MLAASAAGVCQACKDPRFKNKNQPSLLELLLPELPVKTAVRIAAEASGASRNALYDAALRWRKAAGESVGDPVSD